MNSKLIKGSLAGVAALALAAGGTTFAAWSDFNEITGNDVGAGILKLTVAPNSGSQMVFDSLEMAPGGINGKRAVYVASNDGASTPSGRLFLSLKDVLGTEDGCVGNSEILDDPDCGGSNEGDFIDDALLQVTTYAVNSPGDCTPSYAPASKVVTPQHGGSLSWWESQPTAWEVTGNGTSLGGVDRSYLAPGQGLCVSMDISLAYAVDNASQGDSSLFMTRFDLKQAPYGTPTTPLTP
jgi:predicted ribosomally synthesized peptide with SipW-like signal peptide